MTTTLTELATGSAGGAGVTVFLGVIDPRRTPKLITCVTGSMAARLPLTTKDFFAHAITASCGN
jgi:hypothetical protein